MYFDVSLIHIDFCSSLGIVEYVNFVINKDEKRDGSLTEVKYN